MKPTYHEWRSKDSIEIIHSIDSTVHCSTMAPEEREMMHERQRERERERDCYTTITKTWHIQILITVLDLCSSGMIQWHWGIHGLRLALFHRLRLVTSATTVRGLFNVRGCCGRGWCQGGGEHRCRGSLKMEGEWRWDQSASTMPVISLWHLIG